MVKKCPNCGSLEDDISFFCSRCGYRFETRVEVGELPVRPEETIWIGKPHILFILENPFFWIGAFLLIFSLIFLNSYPLLFFGLLLGLLLTRYALELYRRGNLVGAIVLIVILISCGGVSVSLIYLAYVDSVLSVEYLVTKDKIFITKKFIKITKREVPLKEVRDLVVDISFFGRLFGYGDVIPLTGGMVDLWTVSKRALRYSIIRGVPNPESVEKTIRALLTASRSP
jgi:hypothetical protein